ncbi:MAG: radical SAM protein [Proteobacteria bacterium]|nr:radical SAM protein [Pseudomonadota bacterium]MBU4258127.1 radical SAM protein [Pseudomonadota bacterium]MBU4286793.1 radical SAM protein [Pseudomonadota bacterium]MBU4413635.1 radical SAM protein [Pseudomonadota bacterium]MCG2758607.1 radical SAM protein [Desulfobacteraceae bacterium]
MEREKITIYLAELAHNGFGLSLNTIPLGIGSVGAYSKNKYGNQIEIRLFRQFEDLMNAISDLPPHIVGLGYFTWNDNLTLAALKCVREISPDTLIVLGGLNITIKGWENTTNNVTSKKRKPCDEYARKYDFTLLNNNADIDIIVHGDGEVPFSNIIEKMMDSANRLQVKSQPIDGCTTLVDGNLLAGKVVSPLLDLDVIPSPYIMGLYAELFERYQLVPQVESVRGCPYNCTYCTIGGNINKLRKHSLEYIKEEILFLKDNSPNRILRIADSNWGILKRDVELAEFIRELHNSTGYPSSLRVYYAEKGPFENVRRMAKTLKTLLPLNMSFQTLTKEVLKNVKRQNMPISKVKEMVKFAHSNNISVSTELISGLPGETYQSFRDVFLETVKLNFDSVYVGTLYLTKGAELYTDRARKQYGLKTKYVLLGNNITKLNSRYVIDADEVVTESNRISLNDFWGLHKFNFFIFSCYGAAFLKEIIMHCINYQITPLDLYDELCERPDCYPFFNEIADKYMTTVKTKYFDTREELEEAVSKTIKKNGNINEFSVYRQCFYRLGRIASSRYKHLFISDFVKSARSIYDKNRNKNEDDKFHSILDMLGDLAIDVIISPLEEVKKEIVRSYNYDLITWAKDDYKKPLSGYNLKKTRRFSLCVRNINEHRELSNKTKGWGDLEKYAFYFTTVVSSNMRRLIKYTHREDSAIIE